MKGLLSRRPGSPGGSPRLLLVPLVPLVALGALLTAATWMTWIQPTIDSGREINAPSRIAAGERLYRDVVSFYGPVPTWLHAGAYRVAGLHLATPLLLLVPLAALSAFSLLALGRRAGAAEGAAWGVAWGLAIALAAPNGGALVYPYSFAAAHALAFSSAALSLAFSGSRLAPLSAALWGLALAAKPEVAIASGAAAFLAAPLGGRALARGVRAWLASGALLGAALWAVALRGLDLRGLRLEGPLVQFSLPAEWLRLYAVVSGLDDPAAGVGLAVTAAFLCLALLAVALLLERLRLLRPRAVAVAEVALAAAGVAALLLSEGGRLLDRASPPLLACAPAALLGATAWIWLRRLRAVSSPPLLALVAFAAFLSVRVLFGMSYGWRATPYASLAALPIAVAATVLSFRLLGEQHRAAGVALAALVALQSGRILLRGSRGGFEDVATPRGTLRLPRESAAPIRGALGFLASRARPEDEMAGFPEAGFFSFALGIPNVLRQEQVLPGLLDGPAEEAVVRRLEDRRPRFVVLVNQPSAAYGPTSFGRDYAVSVLGAVERLYRPVAFFGSGPIDAPVGPGPFFVRVYEARSPLTPPP